MKNDGKIKYFGDLLALLAGCMLALAFAPIHYSILALVAPAIGLATLLNLSWQRSMWRSWLFGVGLYGIGVSWIYVSIYVYGNTPMIIALLLTGLFIAGLALCNLIQGGLFSYFFPHNNASKILLAFPASWVLMEWMRSWLLTGFPWLYICYSQTNSGLRGYIPILGCYGTSFIVLLMSGLLVYASRFFTRAVGENFTSPIGRGRCEATGEGDLLNKALVGIRMTALPIGSILAIYLLGISLNNLTWFEPSGKPLSVALVQGNIPQQLKWSQEYVDETMQKYVHLTAQNWGADVIVWPEVAIPLPLPEAQNYIKTLDEMASKHNSAIIIGIPVKVPHAWSTYYNAIEVIGKGHGYYYKRHLVPFGEYVPLESWLRGLIEFFNLPMSDMTNGASLQALPVAANVYFAPFICYEIAYPHDLYVALPQAQMLVVMSNDAWFGDSLAPAQHLQIGQFRALQAGRPLLFTANTGITAIVDAKGEIIASIPQFKQQVLRGMVQPTEGMTPWAYLGVWPFVMGCLLVLMVATYKQKSHIKRRFGVSADFFVK